MRVLIVGGSVAGLTLAIMLEKFGIDYLILEGYDDIAPQLGASIGLLPNGLQILDQLGCYERLREINGDVYYGTCMRTSDGTVLAGTGHNSISERLEDKTGYPCIFIDRQMLLQVLYEKLHHKDRVLTGKRVIRVDLAEDGASAVVQDGTTYSGDILVGADGVRSTIREEMWRLAAEEDPKAFPADEKTSLNSDTSCIFGISSQPEGWRGLQNAAVNDGRSYMLIPGPGGRVYWFLFHIMNKRFYGKDIPRFSKADEELLAARYLDDVITDKIRFRDIYENRKFSTLVSLEEHVFSRWHYRRIVLIGDSAHKLNPITAQGGNGAIESAATLINTLRRGPDPLLFQKTPSEPEIERTLGEIRTARFENVNANKKEGRWTTALVCQKLPLAGLLIRLAVPLLGDELFTGSIIKAFFKGVRLDGLDLPQRVAEKSVHNGKLQRSHSENQLGGWAAWSVGLASSGVAAFMIWRRISTR